MKWNKGLAYVLGLGIMIPALGSAAPAKKAAGDMNKGMSQQKGDVIDSFEGPVAPWGSYNADGATLMVNQVEGSAGKALEMKYGLKGPAQWVAISKETALQDPTGKTISFQLKSNDPKANSLEVKFVDEDGSIFGNKVALNSNNRWQQITIPFSDFTYWWGGDKKLDKVKKFEFAISGEPADGSVVIDELKLGK
jgi:hypothetical protein